MHGKFIVIEGLEGAGKTTACKTIANVLRKNGINDVIITREPGGTPLAEKLRDLFKNGEGNELPNIKAEVLILYAARIQLIETVIKPALERGRWVVGDRHDLSSQAYQSGGRNIDPQLILLLRNIVLEGFRPDLTLYLDLPPLMGLKRVQGRGELDRIEKEMLPFFTRTHECYSELVAQDSSIITLDATQSLEQVTNSIRVCLNRWLKTQKNM